MALEDTIFRLKNIQNFLLGKGAYGATFDEIDTYLEEIFHKNSLVLNFSKRTFLRDKETLWKLFNIEIRVTKDNRYYIYFDEEFENEDRDIFDNILLVEAYKQAQLNRGIMYFESRTSRGLKHLSGLVFAIQEHRIVNFEYMSFYTDASEFSSVTVEPYALKEFKYRWYLIGHERGEDKTSVRVFGLDRMKNLDISKGIFKKPKFDIDNIYKHSFGIMTPNDWGKPEKIRLKFDSQQGKYVKTLPIHSSQKIIEDTLEYLIIELYVVPTYDFYQELSSFMDRVEILSPDFVKQEMIRKFQNFIKINQ